MGTKMGAKRSGPKAPIGCEIVDGQIVRKPRKARAKKKASKTPSRGAPTTRQVDELWSVVVRERAIQECQLHGCGERLCGGPMNAHHVFGRGFSVRWDIRNGMCLCWTHHLHYVHNGNKQAAAQEDIREILGAELYEELRQLHFRTQKNSAAFRATKFEELTAELKRLKDAA